MKEMATYSQLLGTRTMVQRLKSLRTKIRSKSWPPKPPNRLPSQDRNALLCYLRKLSKPTPWIGL